MNIYNSNAIEGNRLSIGETRQIVELGLTLTGQSLKDQAEAKNLAVALDYLEDLAAHATTRSLRLTSVKSTPSFSRGSTTKTRAERADTGLDKSAAMVYDHRSLWASLPQ